MVEPNQGSPEFEKNQVIDSIPLTTFIDVGLFVVHQINKALTPNEAKPY